MQIQKRRRGKYRVLKDGGSVEGNPILTQDPGGFPLYRQFRDDGTSYITPTPYNRNYIKISDRGYYPGISLGLGEAEVVAKKGGYSEAQQAKMRELIANNPDLTDDEIRAKVGPPEGQPTLMTDAIDKVVEKTNAGVFGDYVKIPESEREAAEQGVRDDINKAGGTMAALTLGTTSDIYSAPQRYLVNPVTSLLTGKKANYNPMGYTQSMLQNLGYADDPGEGFLSTSEALGIENPYLAFGVDMFTDPSTILGLGSVIKGGLKNLLKSSPRRKVPNQALLDEFLASGNSSLPEEVLLNDIKNPNIKTGVSKAPINVKHGTQAADITADDIKLFEDFPTRGHRPGPKGRKGLGRGGGFYTARGDRGSTFFGTDSRQHQIGLTIPEGSRYIDLSQVMKTDNLPIGDLQKLYLDGYDYIIGRNMLDAEEIIILNPDILKSFKYNYQSGGKFKSINGPKIKVLKK